MKTFEERQDDFNKDLNELSQKHKVGLYAVNAVMDGGEVHPAIKMADTAEKKVNKEVTKAKDASKTKK